MSLPERMHSCHLYEVARSLMPQAMHAMEVDEAWSGQLHCVICTSHDSIIQHEIKHRFFYWLPAVIPSLCIFYWLPGLILQLVRRAPAPSMLLPLIRSVRRPTSMMSEKQGE